MRLIADTIAYTVAARPQVEPDQHLLLPPPGGGRDAGAGDRVHDEQRDRGARRRPRAGSAGADGQACSAGSRSSSTPACGSSRSTPSCGRWRCCGTSSAASATASQDEKHRRFRYGVQVNSLGPDRGAAGEQRLPDRARGARRDARPGRARPGDPAAGLERGARPSPPLGPAVVAAPAADPRLRDRPARVPRHLRGLEGDGRAGRRAARRGPRRDRSGWPSSAARSRRSTT